jgi:fucose permease
MMTRWTMLGELGDFAGPALFAVLAWLSIGWRGAYLVVGGLVALWAIPIALQRAVPSAASDDDEDETDESAGLRAISTVLGNHRLLLWLFGTALCNLLDEILVVFASLHLRDNLGATVVERSAILAGSVIGSALGLIIADRLLRRVSPLRLLAMSAATCAVTYALWILAPTLWLSGLALFAVGIAAAPLYPIAAAQAYAALPGRSGTVNAAGHLFTPLTLAMPWLLGVLADHFGAAAALWPLLLQPLTLVAIPILVAAGNRRGQGEPPP